MKILLIHNYYEYHGGEEVYFNSLKRLLEDNHHTVILYTKNSKNIKTIWAKIMAAFGLFWNPLVAKELNEIIKKEQPDVAHFNNIYPLIGATAYFICKKNKVKMVQTIHNYRFMCPKGILFKDGKICELCINKRFFSPAIQFGCYHGSRVGSFFYSLAFFMHKSIGTFKSINTYIFPSKFTQKYYEKYFQITKSKSVYLPHFIDIKVPKKKARKGDYYLYVGRLSEEKGIIDLLEKYKDMPETKLKIIGGGPLEKQVNTYKVFKNIEVLGCLDRKRTLSILSNAKALLFNSKWYEVSPMIVLESAFIGTNIVFPNINKQTSRYSSKLGNLESIPMKIYIQKINQIYHEITK